MLGASQEVGLAFAVAAHAMGVAVTGVMGLVCLPVTHRLWVKNLSARSHKRLI